MVSAERILAYCKVDQEASLESRLEYKPADDWPSKGDIKVLSCPFPGSSLAGVSVLLTSSYYLFILSATHASDAYTLLDRCNITARSPRAVSSPSSAGLGGKHGESCVMTSLFPHTPSLINHYPMLLISVHQCKFRSGV